MHTPQKDIEVALQVEGDVAPENLQKYLEALNGVPMHLRKSPQEVRDGCILTHHVYLQSLS